MFGMIKKSGPHAMVDKSSEELWYEEASHDDYIFAIWEDRASGTRHGVVCLSIDDRSGSLMVNYTKIDDVQRGRKHPVYSMALQKFHIKFKKNGMLSLTNWPK